MLLYKLFHNYTVIRINNLPPQHFIGHETSDSSSQEEFFDE